MNGFRVRNIRVCFGAREAVRQSSFDLNDGEIVGLIGPNGAGKSTLIRALAGLVTPAGGSLEFLGKPLEKWSARERAKQLAYLPQFPQVHWPLSVHAAVALGRMPHARRIGPLSAADEAAIERALAETGTAALKERAVTTLAGGEKTLVMLARTLASEPKFLLADEPVAGLDLCHQLEVMELLRRLAGSGRGVLAVLHDLTLAARFCDRLLLLKDGRLVCEGTPAQVLTAERLRETYGVDTEIYERDGELRIIPRRRL